MLKPAEIIEKFDQGEVSPAELFDFLLKEDFIDKVKYPYVEKMKLENKPSYNTFCPFHDDQTVGGAFNITNNSKGNKAYCYVGSCAGGQRPLGLLELVMIFVYKVDPANIFEFEITQPFFWKATRFLVEHFGIKLGISLDDLKQDGKKFERNATEDILRATMEYYHFLAVKTQYGKRLEAFLKETRHFDKGVVPIKNLIDTYKLGITPRSDTRDKLYNYLLKKKYTKEQILASSVCSLNAKGEIVDFFIGRAIVPYIHKGKVIGMYGRDLNQNGEKSFRHKRLEGEVRIPNGLDNILDQPEFHLVEGEFSKLAVASLGYSNVMETRGVNGFKTEHAELIQRVRQNNPNICKRCYILFDPDDAGADSVKKIGHRLLNAGVEVLVCRLPVLYQEGEASFIDPNDLLKIYGDQAKNEFDRIKSEAISLDAFLLIHELKKDAPSTLSQARTTMIRFVHYFDSIHPLERIFLLEEVLELMETSIDKNVLRGYLQEVWLKAEQKKPVEGFEKAISSKQAFILVTKSEDDFKLASKVSDSVVLVRDFDDFKSRSITKNMMLDTTFSSEERKMLSRKDIKVIRGQVDYSPENGELSYTPLVD